ncbi:VanZ family protein [Olivibacter sitiensis]|uniref:VanZ family protein n=1 Tax=Olivibacter sitiensis TaxID=376470 RepID=UPI00040CD7C8|nr:VanZ family protein [Olivibacter sitiensis]
MRHFIWAILWGIFVLVTTCMPMDGAEKKVPTFEGMDKLVHTGSFFVFTVLLLYGWSRKDNTTTVHWIPLIAVFLISTVLGGLVELLQYAVFTYRSGDWWDLFADTVGTGMGLFAYLLLHRDFSNKSVLHSHEER